MNLLPDSELGPAMEKQERDRIARATSGMNQSDREALVRQTEELKRRQETPDAPEALKVRGVGGGVW